MANVVLILAAIFMVLSVLRISKAAAHTTHDFVGHIGGIVDCSTRVGREERIAMEMAVNDFHNSTGYKLGPNLRDLSGNSGRAVSAAFDFIKTQQVHAIVGTLTWQEAAYVTEMDEITGRVPVISLATPAIIPFPTQEQVLPVFHMGHELIPLNGSYDEIVERAYLTLLDAYIGDIEISADSYQFVEFSHPYVESGLVMVVPLKTYKSEGPWVFLKPFTKGMWFSMVAISLLTGFVVWVLEHSSNEDFRGPLTQQYGNILWFSFTTLYLGRQRDSLSNLSRFVMASWLFLILIVSATFVASLTSMMTTSRLESGLVMVVPLKTYKSEGPWVFLKPFTMGMWFSMIAISLLTGFVVWVLEHSSNEDFRGPWMQQFGKILWFSFTTLYLGRQRDSLSNLSRFVMAPWLFLILIVSATFVASFTSMMTTSRLEPSEIDVISLKKTNAAVGYDGSILTTRYLEMVLGFKPVNIKSFVSLDDHAQALRNGVIKAGFFSIDRAIVFLAENCKDFTMVFQKDSHLASDISEAVQRLKQSGSGDLQHLEKAMLKTTQVVPSFHIHFVAEGKRVSSNPFMGSVHEFILLFTRYLQDGGLYMSVD